MVLSMGGLAAATAIIFTGATATMAAGASADSLIVMGQDCNANGSVKVTYGWSAAAQGGQWLDLSLVPDNFTTPSVISVGPMASGLSTTVTDNLPAKTPYYARVNTNNGNGWAPSSTLSFTTRTCDGAPSISSGSNGSSTGNAGGYPGGNYGGGGLGSGDGGGMGGGGY